MMYVRRHPPYSVYPIEYTIIFMIDELYVGVKFVTKLFGKSQIWKLGVNELLILFPKYAYSTAWNIWIIIDYFAKLQTHYGDVTMGAIAS